jgi:integrase
VLNNAIFAHLSAPRHITRSRKTLTRDQRDRVLQVAAATDPEFSKLFALGALAGLRRGELLSLTWSDIDFKSKTLKVQNKVGFTTKSGRSRIVPMSDQLLDILCADRPVGAGPTDFVLAPSIAPKPKSQRWSFRKGFESIATKAGVPWLTPHSLRRSFSNLAVQSGVSAWKIKSWLGHSSIAVTERAYLEDLACYDVEVNLVSTPPPSPSLLVEGAAIASAPSQAPSAELVAAF